jgi:4-amino-4-deoxy-L-arabinose transferase-like glycosyltransferase
MMPAARRRPRPATFVLAALGLYAFAILSIGLTRDWRLIHEDNGAIHTTLALSHVRLGLGTTRAHDLFFEPKTGQASVYGHHPPAVALLLAGAFAATGSDAPWVARMVAIAFHLGSVLLLVQLLSRVVPRGTALVGGLLMATVPMSAFFGRMVNHEPLCLFAVLLQLTGYAAFKRGSRRGLVRLSIGILLGGLIDWPALFFAAAVTLAETVDGLVSRPRNLWPAAVPLASAVAIVLFDLWHLWYAGHGSLALYRDLRSGRAPVEWTALSPLSFGLSQVEVLRRYDTHAGLVASLAVGVALAVQRSALARKLFDVPDTRLLKRLLAITGGAASAYVLAAPGWAQVHAYWQFYALPFVVLSMALVWEALRRAASGRHALIARALLAIFVLEVMLTSAGTLHYRHTRPSAYAVRQTAKVRATYLAPASWAGEPGRLPRSSSE